MSGTVVDILIVLGLILVEGVFVGAEIALVSLREGQVQQLAKDSRRGAAVAKLVSDPNRFLATVQIGVTLTALLSSAFGAVTLSEDAKRLFTGWGLPDGLAGFLGIVGVTLVISFVTLVIGELVPKRLALQRSDRVALGLGPALDRMATVVRPVIWLLSRTTDVVVRLLGGDPRANREAISEDELRGLVAAHEALSRDERRIIDHVFAAADRPVREVMIPRTEVEFIEAATTVSRAARQAVDAPHSRFPVTGRSSDDVIGFVHLRDLLDPRHPAGRAATVGDIAREVAQLPGSKRVLAALSEMRRGGYHLAIVVDEYGGTDGIVTLEDLIEEVVGDIRDEYDVPDAPAGPLAVGEYDVDGLCNLDDFAEQTGLRLPDGPYETVAGWTMAALGRLPVLDDHVEVDGLRLTVAELDGRRVSRLRVTTRPPDPAPAPVVPEQGAEELREEAKAAAGMGADTTG